MAWISWSSAARAAFAKDEKGFAYSRGHSSRPARSPFFFSRSPLHTGVGSVLPGLFLTQQSVLLRSSFFSFPLFLSPSPPLFFPGTVTEFQRRPSCRARELLRLPETRRTISPKQRPANGHETRASFASFLLRPFYFCLPFCRTDRVERITTRVVDLYWVDGWTR